MILLVLRWVFVLERACATCVVVAGWVGGCCREEVAAEGGRAAAASDALACTLFFSYSLRLPPNLPPPLSAL